MGLDGTIAVVLGALLAGSGVTWWYARRAFNRRFESRLRRLTEVHRQQHEAVVDKLNASHALARKQLEQRINSPRQVGVASAEQRSSVARLEEQLKAAYAELDSLRLEVKGPAPVGSPSPISGFADTQPFETRKRASAR